MSRIVRRQQLSFHDGADWLLREERVAWVVRWQTVVRALWKRILFDPKLIEELNGDDERRRAYFSTLIGNYTPPVP
jgi:hypothetical protein